MRLVLDWDGTVTERDTLHMAIEKFGDLEVFHALERQIGRELTLNEVIEVEMATIHVPFDDVLAWLLDTVTVRPGFAELVAEHAPLIVSAGFRELILPATEVLVGNHKTLTDFLLPDWDSERPASPRELAVA